MNLSALDYVKTEVRVLVDYQIDYFNKFGICIHTGFVLVGNYDQALFLAALGAIDGEYSSFQITNRSTGITYPRVTDARRELELLQGDD